MLLKTNFISQFRRGSTNEGQVNNQAKETASQQKNIEEEDPELPETQVDESEIRDMSMQDQISYVVKTMPVVYKIAKRSEASSRRSGQLRNEVQKMIDMQSHLLQEVRSLKESVEKLQQQQEQQEPRGKPLFGERSVERDADIASPMNKMPFKTWEAAQEFFQEDNPEFQSVRSKLEQRSLILIIYILIKVN